MIIGAHSQPAERIIIGKARNRLATLKNGKCKMKCQKVSISSQKPLGSQITPTATGATASGIKKKLSKKFLLLLSWVTKKVSTNPIPTETNTDPMAKLTETAIAENTAGSVKALA